MAERKSTRPAEIHWEGDSKEVRSSFPPEIKSTLGFSLRRMQNGKPPVCDSRTMSSIGEGVRELKESDDRTWYRVLYLSRIADVIYVLHCFEKDGSKTDRRDIRKAKDRLEAVR